jgi:O-antigen biosynthesis protein WbqP
MIRFLDLVLSIIGIFFLFPIFIIFLIIGKFNFKSPILVQKRIGKDLKIFNIFKFKSFVEDSYVATHLLTDQSISRYGLFLRKFKIDEIPQLFNVLIGNMSIVGPRPCLLNQKKLIYLRKKKNIFKIRPGITGLSQIKGIDMSDPVKLTNTDYEMIKKLNTILYFKWIFLTIKNLILQN